MLLKLGPFGKGVYYVPCTCASKARLAIWNWDDNLIFTAHLRMLGINDHRGVPSLIMCGSCYRFLATQSLQPALYLDDKKSILQYSLQDLFPKGNGKVTSVLR